MTGAIKRRALRLIQNAEHPLYMFTLTAAEVLQVADVSRMSRDEASAVIGYQRAEVRKHVEEIVQYLNSEPVVFPNAIILALSSKATFVSSRGTATSDGYATAGTLTLPLPGPDDPKPAWIVDGQQRALALSRSTRTDLPVPVTAFIADTVVMQRDQFVRVNNTKPLALSLVTQLLPEVDSPLPMRLAARKVPAVLCEKLNTDPDSPFYRLIKSAAVKGRDVPAAVITYNSVIKMVQTSLSAAGGALYPYRNSNSNETDVEGIHHVLCLYWSAVRDAFPEAWGKSTTESRLMHGAGIVAMGRLMDRILGSIDPYDANAAADTRAQLDLIVPCCRWTSGDWEELGRPWNGIENSPAQIDNLSNYLIRAYVKARAAR